MDRYQVYFSPKESIIVKTDEDNIIKPNEKYCHVLLEKEYNDYTPIQLNTDNIFYYEKLK